MASKTDCGVKVHWTTEREEKVIELRQENKYLHAIKSKEREKWALFYKVRSPSQSHPNCALLLFFVRWASGSA